LYGLAYGGGAYNNGLGYGVIFSYDTAAHTYLDLHDFDSINGFKPLGGLIEATNGKYYGLTPLGGTNDKGTLFSFDPSTNNFTSLYSFNQTTGWYPRGSLKQATDGKLYGMARSGGLNNMGVIFSYDIVLNSYTDLFDFTDVGGYSFGSLIESTNGKLYGMTYSGSSGANTIGNIFYFDPSLNSVSYLHTFNGADGGYPVGDLTETSYIVVPVNLLVDGTVTNNTVCYNATNMITVAGDPPTFTVQSGGHVEMIAGVAIDYKPGTTVQSGGYMWGHITPSGPWCVPITAPSIVTVPMGIEKVQEQSFFKVYPNPTTGSFILELSEVSETSVVKIEIYGMRGEKILNDQFTGEKRHEFSLESNPTGIYFIRVFCGDNLGSQKIIKQ
jgi:uncharacterized repeat protein (TIGR03803 family)